MVINERICEGCGDCGAKSNCLSVQPIETPYGRKTAIHQTSCNFDLSCMQGDCPAFATVPVNDAPREAASKKRRKSPEAPTSFPSPAILVDRDRFSVRLSGIGGTGVVTVSQILGTAAMLDGLLVRGLDQTGLSQKAGPVVSDVLMSRSGAPASNSATSSGIDAFLAFDLLAAASDAHRAGASPKRTVVVGSVEVVPTGAMVVDPNRTKTLAPGTLTGRLDEVSRVADNRYVDATAICRGLFGGSTAANILMLGVAVQLGAIPIDPDSMERAITLNGVAVEQNIAAFRFGRQWVVAPAAVNELAHVRTYVTESTPQLIERLAADLVDYQDERYSRRFLDRLDAVQRAESAVSAGSTTLVEAVARNLYKLMAYKDEYEVARLALLDESTRQYEAVGGAGVKVSYRLHPPMLRALGVDHKIELRRTGGPAFKALRAMKRVRGTRADLFGYAEVRRTERALVLEYEKALDQLVRTLSDTNLDDAVRIAQLPDQVRGYEHIKMRRVETYRAELAAALVAFGR